MSTPILETLLPKVREHGRSQAKSFLEGGASIGGTADDEVIEFVSRLDISWGMLTVAEQDRIRDEFLEGFREGCQRPIPSPPAASLAADPHPLLKECQTALRGFYKEVDYVYSTEGKRHLWYKVKSQCFAALEKLDAALGKKNAQ